MSCEMAAMSACSQESLLFSMKSWSLMPNMIFAKQKSLKPGREGLCLSPPTLVCVAWEGKAVRLCISYWKRELTLSSEFLWLSLGGGMHGSAECPRAVCRRCAGRCVRPGAGARSSGIAHTRCPHRWWGSCPAGSEWPGVGKHRWTGCM